MDTPSKQGSRKGRPNYPIEFKRRLAQAASEATVSVSRLAREHGVNANMVFRWRREHQAGLLGHNAADQAALVPVVVTDMPKPSAAQSACSSGCIEIAFADVVVRIEGAADSATVRAVLQGLRP
jgi:transposase